MSGGSGNVRPISPEDVYDDRNQRSVMNNSVLQHHHDMSQSFQSFQSSMGQDRSYYQRPQNHYAQPQQPSQQQHYAQPQYHHPAPSNRQISNTSTINTVTSGSENWETYDDASDPEPDATEVYYAKLRAAQGKRFASEDPYGHSSSAGKKTKGIRGVGPCERLVEQNGQMVRADGSDGWTDEMEPY
jgi:protein regulator of cytokinesis 1